MVASNLKLNFDFRTSVVNTWAIFLSTTPISIITSDHFIDKCDWHVIAAQISVKCLLMPEVLQACVYVCFSFVCLFVYCLFFLIFFFLGGGGILHINLFLLYLITVYLFIYLLIYLFTDFVEYTVKPK